MRKFSVRAVVCASMLFCFQVHAHNECFSEDFWDAVETFDGRSKQPPRESNYVAGSRYINVGASVYVLYNLYDIYVADAPGNILVPTSIRSFGYGVQCVAAIAVLAVKTMLYKTAAQLLLLALADDSTTFFEQ